MKRLLLFLLILTLMGQAYARIVIYGDTRTQDDQHLLVAGQIARHRPELVLHTGDISQRGETQAEYDNFFALTASITAPIYPARGNHERSETLFLKNFPKLGDSTWYTIEHDSLLFVFLDSTKPLDPASGQYAWLNSELDRAKLPIILILHHPIFSSGQHGDELGLSLFLPNLLNRYQVKAVFSAHDHSYEHLYYKGIHYIVTGGGGAPLRDVKALSPYSLKYEKTHHYCLLTRAGKQLQLKVYDQQGREIDGFDIDL